MFFNLFNFLKPKKNRKVDLRFRRMRFESMEQRNLLSVSSYVPDFSDEAAAFTSSYSYASSGVLKYNAAIDDLIGLTAVEKQYGLSGANQTVVIIDSGITTDHNAFSDGQIVGGWDFAENDADYSDTSLYGGHGTHLAGIIGGSTTKYTGVAPGVEIVVLRVFGDDGIGSFELIESALQWVEKNLNTFDNPITAVNLSLGSVATSSNSSDWTVLDDEL